MTLDRLLQTFAAAFIAFCELIATAAFVTGLVVWALVLTGQLPTIGG